MVVVIAGVGLRQVGRKRESIEIPVPDRRELARTFGRFVGLTIINPTTIVYFAAVVVGMGIAKDMSASEALWFVVGAFVASLSWQSLLAGVGTFAGDRLGSRAQTAAVVLGNLVILAFAAVIVFR